MSGGRGPRWAAAAIAMAVGLPLGLAAVAWIGLDGWGSYRDGQHLGRLLAEAWVTMLVLAVGSAALGAVVGHHGWQMGLVAWPVAVLGLPSLVGASGPAAAAAAVLIAAGSVGVAALGGIAGAGLRARALPATGLLLAATLAGIVALHVAGGWLSA